MVGGAPARQGSERPNCRRGTAGPAWDERREACERVASTPARTQAGMMAKLALVAPYFDDIDLGHGASGDILASVMVDFKTLQAAA